jgi:serine/threonine protein kinase
MPPEQIDGNLKLIGPASDIYSLGVVLFELLTGAPPFPATDLLALASQIALDTPPPPSVRRPGLDRRLDAICAQALAKKPAARFPSMQALADELTPLPAEPSQRTLPALGPAFTLQVEGTPHIYRPPPGLSIITVGRQRRKPGDSPEQGSDFVLRVSGRDALSTRISRRHFEIHGSGEGYSIIDRSKGGTILNGQRLQKDVPALLSEGDRISVAGVVELLFRIASAPVRGAVRREIQVPATAGENEFVVLEASLGDMMTIE